MNNAQLLELITSNDVVKELITSINKGLGGGDTLLLQASDSLEFASRLIKEYTDKKINLIK